MNNTYNYFDKVIVRTPISPFKPIYSTAELIEKSNNCLFYESLFLASPILVEEISKLSNYKSTDIKKYHKIVYSLDRYNLRSFSRCTPYGLFAGCRVVKVASKENSETSNTIILDELGSFTRHTRLDMNYVCALSMDLAKKDYLRSKLHFFPNNSLYKVGDTVRFVEYRFVKNRRIHHLVSVELTDYLHQVLEKAKNGVKLHDLVQTLRKEDVTVEEAIEYVDELIESEILVSELEPTITGPEFIEQLLIVLKKVKSESALENDEKNDDIIKITNIINVLERTQYNLQKIDNSGLGVNINKYIKISEDLKTLGTDFEMNTLFQCDMNTAVMDGFISDETAVDILSGLDILNKLTLPQTETLLHKFRDAFYERYEEREIPLCEALDSECGIGYPANSNVGDVAPLVDDLYVSWSGKSSSIKWNKIQSFLLKKYIYAKEKNSFEVEISANELEDFETKTDDLPDTFSCMVSLTENNSDKYPHGRISFSIAGGSSAANLIGRFCHANAEIEELTKMICQKERELNPEKILAEIVHLPESRLGNILLRPILREYEIPYLARPAVSKENIISLDDLMISVRENRVFLRSKEHNKEITPHLSTAHNYSMNSLPIYHFLCDIQTQNLRGGIGFNWGVLSNEYKFLPRVIYKNIIFHPATWQFKKEDYEDLLKVKDKDEELSNAVNKWRESNRIPQQILLADGDNELFIDLNNILCVKTLLNELKGRDSAIFHEFLFDMKNPVVTGPEGSFTNQFIFSFYRKEKKCVKNFIKKEERKELNIPYKHIPGDEWLFYKIYTGVKTSDIILTKVIKPICEELIIKHEIDKWFFIRYNDPDTHIRLRFHSLKSGFEGQLLSELNKSLKPFIKDGLVLRIQIDTYQRELERYGYETMELTESLFYHDSRATVAFLDLIEGDEGEQLRWLMAFRNIDCLLNDFQYSLVEKLQLLENLKDNFGKEFGINKSLKIHLDKKYRDNRSLINNIMNYSTDKYSDYLPLYNIYTERSKLSKKIVECIINLAPKEKLNNYLGSYAHMTMNRLFKSKQRLHELVVYDFLYRQYKSFSARKKGKRNSKD